MSKITCHPPVSAKAPFMLHGADYNPDQWLHDPAVFEEDLRLMDLAHCNVFSVGIFSWAALEPEEGVFTFDWMDNVLDRLAERNKYVLLATPSGSKPAWMSRAYPEVCRMDAKGIRERHQTRHNHCRTSPVFREKCRIMNTKLAERYRDHPALILWHVSNEYNGEDCHCPLCYDAFREWLKLRYNNDLDLLNRSWWTGFWSHTFTDWNQIEPVDNSIQGMKLDWRRFTSDQMIDFFKDEAGPLREIAPDSPIVTNFMGTYPLLDYWKFAKELDVVSWDNYPDYHNRPDDWLDAIRVSFVHDLNRSFKQKPFLLMESSPSSANWKQINKLKRPGIHTVEGLQAIAHGSDSVQYFQWRKGRGGHEKFHGAVVDHYPIASTRVFDDVAQVGGILKELDDVVGTSTPAEVAILYDWENKWAMEGSCGPRNEGRDYDETVINHYRSFWSNGVACDAVNEDSDLSGYKLIIAPMLYMVRPGLAERLAVFVENGGTFVTTYHSGVVDESDLCFQNGFPGPLRELMGIWCEETDVLYDEESVSIIAEPDNCAGLSGSYDARQYCDLIHAESAAVMARYGSEFYKDRPALTVNAVGKGNAWYMASRNEHSFHRDFYTRLIDDLGLRQALGTEFPDGVTAQIRTDGQREFIFLLGFNREAVKISLGSRPFTNLLTNETVTGEISLKPYSTMILE